jgi:adenosine deaminase
LPEIVAALKGAAPASLTVCVYAGFARDLPEVLDERMKQAIWDTTALDGLDLYGDERKGEPAPFADFFALAREHGLSLKAHAGELLGPRSIEQALDHLGVKRIEHGVAAAQDEALMQRLVAEGVTLDVCPTSNLKLKVVERLADHPIRRLHQRGVCVTANTDDPTIFGCSLSDELGVLVGKLGFSVAAIAQLEINAFEAAKLPAAAREAIIAEIASLSN